LDLLMISKSSLQFFESSLLRIFPFPGRRANRSRGAHSLTHILVGRPGAGVVVLQFATFLAWFPNSTRFDRLASASF
jgi:hypothetical protein